MSPIKIFTFGAVASTLFAIGQAHAISQGDCANRVVSSCNSKYPNNYDARIACVNAGLDACDSLASAGGRDPIATRFNKLKLAR